MHSNPITDFLLPITHVPSKSWLTMLTSEDHDRLLLPLPQLPPAKAVYLQWVRDVEQHTCNPCLQLSFDAARADGRLGSWDELMNEWDAATAALSALDAAGEGETERRCQLRSHRRLCAFAFIHFETLRGFLLASRTA